MTDLEKILEGLKGNGGPDSPITPIIRAMLKIAEHNHERCDHANLGDCAHWMRDTAQNTWLKLDPTRNEKFWALVSRCSECNRLFEADEDRATCGCKALRAAEQAIWRFRHVKGSLRETCKDIEKVLETINKIEASEL